MNVKNNTTIKLLFSVILNEDLSLSEVEYDITDLVYGKPLETDVNAIFTRSNTIKGTVPTDNINSDNLGCYIAEVPNKPYTIMLVEITSKVVMMMDITEIHIQLGDSFLKEVVILVINPMK